MSRILNLISIGRRALRHGAEPEPSTSYITAKVRGDGENAVRILGDGVRDDSIRSLMVDGVTITESPLPKTIVFGDTHEHTIEVEVADRDRMPSGLFKGSSLVYASIPEGFSIITQEAFHLCSYLDEVVLPSGLTTIDGNSFKSCEALRVVRLPSSVLSIGPYAFDSCSVLGMDVNLPNLTSLDTGAFYETAITSVRNLGTIETVSMYAFYECTLLTKAVLPPTVTSIGYRAFKGCSALAELVCEATTPPTLDSDALTGTPADMAIKVPAGSVGAYKLTQNWSARATYISAIE